MRHCYRRIYVNSYQGLYKVLGLRRERTYIPDSEKKDKIDFQTFFYLRSDKDLAMPTPVHLLIDGTDTMF